MTKLAPTTLPATEVRRRADALEHKIDRLNTLLAMIGLVSLIGITLLGSFLLPYFVIRYGWVK